MNVLLAAATAFELAPFVGFLRKEWKEEDGVFYKKECRLHVLITGVGVLATAYSLARFFNRHPIDFALQAGVAGSYLKEIPLGSLVQIKWEQLGDAGAEDHYQFRDVFELGLLDENEVPFSNKKLITPQHPLQLKFEMPKVSGLTVSAVSGSSFTAALRFKKYGCAVESMEGAAFHYACLMENIPFVQVRSISNYVEARNRDAWEMPLAIANLNGWLEGLEIENW